MRWSEARTVLTHPLQLRQGRSLGADPRPTAAKPGKHNTVINSHFFPTVLLGNSHLITTRVGRHSIRGLVVGAGRTIDIPAMGYRHRPRRKDYHATRQLPPDAAQGKPSVAREVRDLAPLDDGNSRSCPSAAAAEPIRECIQNMNALGCGHASCLIRSVPLFAVALPGCDG